MDLVELAPRHAEAAARLHIMGQPGTFLSELGPNVLTVLYRALPASPAGFGFSVLGDDDDVLGFVSATTSVGKLFVELGVRRFGQFLPALTVRYVRKPSLIWRSGQTVLYPLLVRDPSVDNVGPAGNSTRGSTAELLSIMVQPTTRSRGVGSRLVQRLCEECVVRGVTHLDVTVDAENDGARRFYMRHHFELQRTFALYGRQMCQYRRLIEGS